MAFRVAIETRYGSVHLPGTVAHLWHPRSAERAEVRRPDGMVLLAPEYYDNTKLGSRWMAAEGCEHCVGRLVDEAAAARREFRTGTTVIILSNGRREYIAQAIDSAERHLSGAHIVRRIWDDSGSFAYVEWLRETYPAWIVVGDARGTFTHRGYTGAMQHLWRYIGRRITTPYVFLLEEDFVLEGDVDLSVMADVLTQQGHLAQLVLLRHAFYPKEIEAGGIIGEHPESYTPKRMNGYAWLEHERFWSNNPCLFRRELVQELPWPNARHSEAVYGRELLRRGMRFAFWGDGTPQVRHVGTERTGDNY
jgi:hypothetical protein